MKLKWLDYEVEIKAKNTITRSERYNKKDTDYMLNELQLILIYAAKMFDESDDRYLKILSKKAREIDEDIDKSLEWYRAGH